MFSRKVKRNKLRNEVGNKNLSRAWAIKKMDEYKARHKDLRKRVKKDASLVSEIKTLERDVKRHLRFCVKRGFIKPKKGGM